MTSGGLPAEAQARQRIDADLVQTAVGEIQAVLDALNSGKSETE
jgi:hypothetical protein